MSEHNNKRNALPNVTFHYTPTSASQLNQMEIWFGIMARKVLRGANLTVVSDTQDVIEKYIAVYNKAVKPFVWKKRKVVGSQIQDTLANLCS